MEKPRKPRGRPRSLTPPLLRVPIGLRVSPEMKETLETKARENGHTHSQEAMRLMEVGLRYEHSKRDLDQMQSAAMVQAIRAAGLQLVGEVGGGYTVNVSTELLMATADGILRSGFIAPDDAYKSPTEIMVERALAAATDQIADQVAAKVLKGLAKP